MIKILLLAAFFFQSVAWGGSKIAAVNLNSVMEQAPQAQLASEEMKDKFADKEKELLVRRDEIRELEKKYKRDKDVISTAEREKNEQYIRDQLRDFKRDSDNFTEDFNMARNEALDKLQSDVYKAIISVAEKEKYDLVLSESVLYASNRVDITDKVLAEMRAIDTSAP
jgi:outer membrane protein